MRKFAALLCLFLAGPAFGTTHKVPPEEPIATIQIPDKWQTKEIGEVVEATSPDGTIFLVAVPGESNKINESIGEVMRYLRSRGALVVDAKTLKQEHGKLNGMELRNVSWDAKDAKGPIMVRFAIVTLAEKEPLIVAYFASPEAEKKHKAALDKILKSVKKV